MSSYSILRTLFDFIKRQLKAGKAQRNLRLAHKARAIHITVATDINKIAIMLQITMMINLMRMIRTTTKTEINTIIPKIMILSTRLMMM